MTLVKRALLAFCVCWTILTLGMFLLFSLAVWLPVR